MNFKDVLVETKRKSLEKLLHDRQTKVIPDSSNGYWFRDTLVLSASLSGVKRMEFFKLWFSQLKPDNQRARLYVNKKHRYTTNGKYADKELVELINSGFLVMRREGLLKSRDTYLEKSENNA